MQDACAFYKDHAVYNQFNGAVLAEEEGMKIAEKLGNKKVRRVYLPIASECFIE